MIKLSDYVINFISDLGIGHIFLLPGGGCMHLVDSIGKKKSLQHVCMLHEQAAVIAADGYAQYSNNIAAAIVTTGPGGTNAITGVAAAWIDSTPLIVISGQVKRKDLLVNKGVRQMGIQEVDIISIVRPVTKYAVTVTEPEDIKYHMEKAVYLAKTGRPGPVWIDIPLDVQGAVIDENNLRAFEKGEEECSIFRKKGLNKQVAQCINLLNSSKRPVILAGRGIRLSGAEQIFKDIIDKLKIPVLTTWRMTDFLPEDGEIYFGRPGSIASRYANFIQQSADFILVIGARLDLPQVGHNYQDFARSGIKVIVDIDENEIKKTNTKIDLPIISDAGDFIKEFALQSVDIKLNDISEWIETCKKLKNKYPVILKEYLKPAKYVNTYALIDAISDLLSEKDLLVPGSSGSCAEITLQAFRAKSGQRVINSPGLGSMGFGLPQSIGVCLASGGRRTICIIGDGGLQHNIQELETLKRLNIPVKIFVLNNNGYAAIRNTHNKFFEGRLVCCDPSSGLTLPDNCKIASAYGLKVKKIKNQYILKEEVESVLNDEGPVLCEVMIDPDLQTAPKLSSVVNDDGSIVSKPLEDLWPFLDRKELEKNMLILLTNKDKRINY